MRIRGDVTGKTGLVPPERHFLFSFRPKGQQGCCERRPEGEPDKGHGPAGVRAGGRDGGIPVNERELPKGVGFDGDGAGIGIQVGMKCPRIPVQRQQRENPAAFLQGIGDGEGQAYRGG